jgi:hypothetical protein
MTTAQLFLFTTADDLRPQAEDSVHYAVRASDWGYVYQVREDQHLDGHGALTPLRRAVINSDSVQ